MKKGKLLLVALASASLCLAITACGHTHEYSGSWEITTEPTETTGGSARRECTAGDGEYETHDLPALTDDSVWTLTSESAASHTAAGSKVYTSDYGTVTVTIPAETHTYGEWTIVTEPTETATGEAKRLCTAEDGGEETVTLPVLTDTTVWTLSSETAATHTATGSKVYTSDYGTVTITIPAGAHTFGDWEITAEPTETATGEAKRVCTAEDGGEETVTLPVLTDTSFWTRTEIPADYTKAGEIVYSNDEYGLQITQEGEAQLSTPFANHTYMPVEISINDNKNAEADTAYIFTWPSAVLALDISGKATPRAYPFGEGEFTVTALNDGKVLITSDAADPVTYYGYYDAESMIIIIDANSTEQYKEIYFLTPFETAANTSSFSSSYWNNSNARAIEYTFDGTTYRVFILNGSVYFNVSFKDAEGNAIAGVNCYNAEYLYVYDADGGLIASYGYNGTKLQELDGLEGSYTGTLAGENAEVTLFFTGLGTVKWGEVEGTYEQVSGEEYLGVYLGNVYYQITLDGETFTSEKFTASISFVSAHSEHEAVEANINIAYTLPVPEADSYVFRGWYTSADFSGEALTSVTPTSTDSITLYAKWLEKIVISAVVDGETTVYNFAKGETLDSQLPVYGVDEENMRIFVRWYAYNGEDKVTIQSSGTVSASSNGVTIYAEWEELPVYYGTYYGSEVWGTNWLGSAGTLLTIDETGKMTGKYSGTVESYNTETQQLTVKNGNTTYYFWFDTESGVLVSSYYSGPTYTYIAADIFVFIKGVASGGGEITANYAISTPRVDSPSSIGYYTRFLTVKQSDGSTVDIVLYNNRIYTDIMLENSMGESMTIADIAASKTVVAFDANGNRIFAFACAEGKTSFSNASSSESRALDAYYGTYTSGDETLVLDGVGGITYGDKTGTYTKVDGADYGFDVYLESDTEYYRLTVDVAARTFTIEKPMVTLVFDSDYSAHGDVSLNVNIAYAALPEPTSNEAVFRGWYTSEDFSGEAVTSITADGSAASITLYAKWLAPVTVTVYLNYEEGETPVVHTIAVGETLDLENPERDENAFLGWYTDATDGDLWVAGENTVTENITIYAHWGAAPAFTHTYSFIGVQGGTTNGGVSTYDTRTASYEATIKIVASGKGTRLTTASYPFAGETMEIVDYDEETGSFLLYIYGSSTVIRRGYVDSVSGIMVINTSAGATANFSSLGFMSPFERGPLADSFASSYWNSGKSRAVEYTYDGTTYRLFLYNDVVYFNVTFVDLQDNPVAADQAYQATSLYVLAADGTKIEGFAYNGTTMQVMDGTEGVYTGTLDGEEISVVVTGTGFLTLGATDGTCTVDDSGVLLCFVDNVYYEITLNAEDMTFTIVKPMVTVSFVSDHSTPDPVTVNAKIAYTALPVPEAEGYVFRGWFASADFSGDALTSVTPAADTTVYAKWDPVVTLTVVYQTDEDITGLPNVTIDYGAGDLTAPVKPAYQNGKAFEYWYTLQDGEEVQYTAGTAITEDTTIYAKWTVADPLYGSYAGFETSGQASSGYTINGGSSNYKLVIDKDGNITSGISSFVGASITGYDKTTGIFRIVASAGTETEKSYYGYFDSANGVIVVNYRYESYNAGFNGQIGNDIYVLFMDATSAATSSSVACYWNAGLTRLMRVTIDGNAVDMLLYNNVLYYNVTWTSTDTSATIANVYSKSDVTVYDSEGNLIAEFVKGISGLMPVDSSKGTYTSSDGDTLTLDGGATIVWDEKTGTYVKAAEGSDWDYDVTFTGEYYRLTVDITEKTFTIVKPMATLVFNTFGKADVVTVEQNLKQEFTFTNVTSPVAEGFVFGGWYDDEECTSIRYRYTPEETGTVTFYAKWIPAYSLTIVYGNGLDAAVQQYQEGATVSPTEPPYTNGKAFAGWYLDEALETPYTLGSLTGDLTIYAAWEETMVVVKSTSPYAWSKDEDGVWSSGNQGVSTSTSTLTITVYAAGLVSFDWRVSSETNYDKLTITLNSTTLVDKVSGEESGSISQEVVAGDVFTISYVKDSSTNRYDDTAYIENIVFTETYKLTFGESEYTLSEVAIENNDTDTTWFTGATSTIAIDAGDFALAYTWQNTRDTAWYQDAVIEFYFTAEDETKTYFDMNFLLGGNAWGGLVTAATSHTTALTLNGESVATQPEQGSTISYLGDYTVEIVRIGSTLTVTQTLVTTDGDVYQAVDVFEGITTEALTGLIVGNPYFCDNIAAYYCAIV